MCRQIDFRRGVLILDDTTLDKLYGRHMELVTRHWSGKHQSVVRGINLMERAGVPAEQVRPALAGLAAGALENVRERGPAEALTGPVARGDDETVARHLARLSGDERALYSLLAREALKLARVRGLDGDAVARVAALIGEE